MFVSFETSKSLTLGNPMASPVNRPREIPIPPNQGKLRWAKKEKRNSGWNTPFVSKTNTRFEILNAAIGPVRR